MDLNVINARVDRALQDNRRDENIIVAMAIGIFLLGVATVVLAYWRLNPYFATGTVVLQGFLYWPVREILKLRKDNLILQPLPVLVSSLPPEKAADEIKKLLEHLRRS